MLETSEQIRKFHKKLFQQAKQEPKFRFYILYDTVYRLDILGHTYNFVRAGKGAAGGDGLALTPHFRPSLKTIQRSITLYIYT